MRSNKTAVLVLMCVLSLGWVAAPGRVVAKPVAAKPAAGKSAYRPHIDPANFQTTIDNPYLPLVPGTTFKYAQTMDGSELENEITVTHDTKVIMGVPCVVVHDVVKKKGAVLEDTYDWYAQDKQGNVWYFGEDTKEFLAGGKVITKGSWEAGVKGDQPGIIMKSRPAVGAPYRQEYSVGNAEDMGQIVLVDDSITVPYGSFNGCVRTKEWSLLEPGFEKKWYAKGVGFVRSESTDKEVSVLVSVTHP